MLEALSSLAIFAQDSGVLGIFVCFLIYTVGVVLIFPGLWLGLLFGFIYGPWWGMAALLPGSVVGASCSFLLGRHVLRDRVLKHVHLHKHASSDLKKISAAFSTKGPGFITLVFASPPAPFRVLAYIAGATELPFRDFVIALLLSMGPHMLPVAYAGSLAKNVGDIVENPSQLMGSIGASVPYFLGLLFTVVATIALVIKVRQVLNQL